MRASFLSITAALSILTVVPAAAQTSADTAGIRATAHDYIDGWYSGDGDRMEHALHTHLAKRLVRLNNMQQSALVDLTAAELIQGTRAGHGKIPRDQWRDSVTILDIFGNDAVARIDATTWVDFLQLIKWNGEWKIINVTWENRPPSAWDSLFADLRRDTLRDLKGVRVERRGRVLAEAYFNGDDSTTLHDIRSATKSITSTLVGIAIDRGLIKGVDRPVYRGIALRDLLTMRSGLDAGNEDALDQSDDWSAFADRVPVKWPPGTRYVYSSLDAYLAGAAVERATGVPLSVFAESTLFRPLGIREYQWRRGPRGEGVGQGNLSISLRDMARIGDLYLNGGVRDGHRVVSATYITHALASLVPISASDPYADAYGYMWYTKSYIVHGDTVVVHFASGNGGNKIYIVPRDSLTIAITSSAYNTRYGQRRSEDILKRILGSVPTLR